MRSSTPVLVGIGGVLVGFGIAGSRERIPSRRRGAPLAGRGLGGRAKPPENRAGSKTDPAGVADVFMSPVEWNTKHAGIRQDVTVCFDLDGSLLDLSRPVNFADVEQVAAMTPIADACAKAKAIFEAGHAVAIVTGRTARLREITERQVAGIFGRPVPILLLSSWTNVADMVDFKANALRTIGASLYVGDSLWDAWAAGQANVPFLRYNRLAGFPLEGVGNPRVSPMVSQWHHQ